MFSWDKEIQSLQFFLDCKQNLFDSLELKVILWDLDDLVLSDDIRTILKHLKKLLKLKQLWDTKLNPRKMNFFLDHITGKKDHRLFEHLFEKSPRGSNYQQNMYFSLLIHSTARIAGNLFELKKLLN